MSIDFGQAFLDKNLSTLDMMNFSLETISIMTITGEQTLNISVYSLDTKCSSSSNRMSWDEMERIIHS